MFLQTQIYDHLCVLALRGHEDESGTEEGVITH